MSKQSEVIEPEKAAQILQKGSIDAVVDLFDKYGRDFSLPVGNILYNAAKNTQHPEVLYYLIHYQKLNDQINQSANDREVPLIGAAFVKNVPAMKILIASGAIYKDSKFRTVNDFQSYLRLTRFMDKELHIQVAKIISAYEKREDLLELEKAKVEAILLERQLKAPIPQATETYTDAKPSVSSFFSAVRSYVSNATSATSNPPEDASTPQTQPLLGGPPSKFKRE